MLHISHRYTFTFARHSSNFSRNSEIICCSLTIRSKSLLRVSLLACLICLAVIVTPFLTSKVFANKAAALLGFDLRDLPLQHSPEL